jgi:alkanesulfonate monooxygenase SsuD/methylene tetrahydromethanopterin reductase-like flavin-dependent oxidoreductase (luciferase family)
VSHLDGVAIMVGGTVRSGDDLAREAQHAERLGFDMVTLHPDHPSASGVRGSGRSHEVWTAITWMLARTARIKAAPAVVSLPYRHPAVVAKMAESLDRLSGGRLVLPVGAGGDDAAFDAFGLPRWSDGEKVSALGEALDILPGLWREPAFDHSGEHFVLSGASINPRPDRRIPVWVGAYGDRLLTLTGRKADGWLASRRFLPPVVADRLAIVRRSAERAGRDPDSLAYAVTVAVDVRASPHVSASDGDHVLAGSPNRVVDGLLELVRAGFTWLVLWPARHDVEQAEMLATDVLAPLRAASAAGR